jgi:hypothetical protein
MPVRRFGAEARHELGVQSIQSEIVAMIRKSANRFSEKTRLQANKSTMIRFDRIDYDQSVSAQVADFSVL